jgi:hypothetical protein
LKSAQHVDQNSEELRDKFVDFDGKKVLKVTRDGFRKGCPDNDWEGVFPEFTEQISACAGKELLHTTVLEFSTTTKIEKTRNLSQYDLKWWTKELIPVLEEFVRASEGAGLHSGVAYLGAFRGLRLNV